MLLKKKTTPMALGLAAALVLTLPGVSPLMGQARALDPDALPIPSGAVVSASVAVREEVLPLDLYGVRVNGVPMTRDPMLTDVEGQTYVSLRAVAQALDPQVEISWDGVSASLVHWGLLDLSAAPGQVYAVANGRCLYVPNGVQAANGAVLLPLDVMCKAFDATYTYNADGSLDLTTGSGALAPADQFYDEDDLYWLSHIIYAESGNQPLTGKLAVGNVVLNRVADSRFPSTVKGVIYQKNQFSPVANGTIHRTPSAESVLAAKLCLDGAVSLENVLWFNRKGLRSWAARNRTAVATIAGHTFYA